MHSVVERVDLNKPTKYSILFEITPLEPGHLEKGTLAL